MKFSNIIDREELYDALAVNPSLEIAIKEVEGLQYCQVDNFLKSPEKAIMMLTRFPVLKGTVYVPGDRQNFNPSDIAPIVKGYSQISKQIGADRDATQFSTSSIIANKDSKVWYNSWLPHIDAKLVVSLWLCEYNGGTAFYKPNRPEVQAEGFAQAQGKFDKTKLVPSQKFEGNDDWTLYHILPTIYNTLYLYDGAMPHSTYATMKKNYRYSLQSFSYSEISKYK